MSVSSAVDDGDASRMLGKRGAASRPSPLTPGGVHAAGAIAKHKGQIVKTAGDALLIESCYGPNDIGQVSTVNSAAAGE